MNLARMAALTTLCFSLVTQYCFADTCPTPTEIAAGQFNGWVAYVMSTYPIPATPAQIQVFQTYSNLEFTYALWHVTLPPLPAVCVYTDPGIILAKNDPQPMVIKGGTWQEENRLGQTIYSCMDSDPAKCIFGVVPQK